MFYLFFYFKFKVVVVFVFLVVGGCFDCFIFIVVNKKYLSVWFLCLVFSLVLGLFFILEDREEDKVCLVMGREGLGLE